MLRVRRTSNLDDYFDSIYFNNHASLQKLVDTNPSSLRLRDSRGGTLLHRSVEECNSEKLQSFLDLGCDVNYLTRNDKSALHLAVEHGYVDAVKILLQHGADADGLVKDDSQELTLLRLAIKKGLNHTEIARKLLRHGARINRVLGGKAALHDAIQARDVEMVRCLLACGADANLPFNGKTPLCMSIILKSIPIAELLLESGAKINDPSSWIYMNLISSTPLSFALLNQFLPLIEFLLDHGADPSPPLGGSFYSNCFSPIILAVKSGSITVVKCLLRANCDLNWEETPRDDPILCSLTRAGSTGIELVKLLLQAGYSLRKIPAQTSLLLANECQRNPEFSAWLSNWNSTPQSLQMSCVYSMRRCLRAGIKTKLERLGVPVPWKLKRLILLEELLAE